ncbi:endoglucanase 11-like [Dorcoceras hygrometricum]|nr:endoglucanase 11-like [Dorcoceras hygrometricum]
MGERKRQCQCMPFPQLLVQILFLFSTLPSSRSFDYGDALAKSLLYFEAQRSGHLPYNQRVTWRHHSGLTDGLEQGVDLVGGYYDAGDNVKFGLPMAFTITMLSWAVIEFYDEIDAAGELRHALEAIKWGTDYFIKAHTNPNVLWAMVGDGDTDHLCWQRPEDMTTSRRAYKLDENNPGSEVAAETAAAMAAAAIVFRKTNRRYSHLLLEHAKQLFEFGDKFREKYDLSIKEAKGYYPSLPMEGKSQEQKDILNQYRSKGEQYICACLNKNNSTNVRRTPGGLLYTRRWNNMQYVSTSVFLLTLYSDHLQSTDGRLNCDKDSVSSDEILSFVKSQVHYILGSNPMGLSYLVGYGPSYPNRVHHRGASIDSFKDSKAFVGCKQGYDNWFGRQKPNPNVIVGALVGGPDEKDNFMDRRGNFAQTEACTYNTAPLVGVFAKLHSLEKGNSTSTASKSLSLVSFI